MLRRCSSFFNLYLELKLGREIKGKEIFPFFVSSCQRKCMLGHYKTLRCAAGHVVESHDQSIQKVSSSFKEWFIQCQVPQNAHLLATVKHINSILSTGKWGADTENLLKKLNLTLTEQCVVRVLKHQKDVALGMKFFDWARQQSGYTHTMHAYYTFFKMLSRTKLTRVMEEWLDFFQKHNADSVPWFYCTLIAGYSLAGKPELALQIFEQMHCEGLILDKFSYNELVNILAKENCFEVVDIIEQRMPRRKFEVKIGFSVKIKSLCEQGKLDEAKQVLNELSRNGFSANEIGIVSLVSALSKEGKLDEAEMLIEESRKGGLIPMYKVHHTWIGCLLEENRVDEALDYFEKRVSEGFHPGSQCYGALVTGLLKNNRYREVNCLLNDMRDNHIVPNARTMNDVVRVFCKRKLINVAIDLYNEISEIGFTPDNCTYSKIINALCISGKVDEAYKVLDDGMAAGFFPRKHTLSILLNALCMAGKLDKVHELFVAGIERQCIPDFSTFSEAISAFSQAGRIDDGYAILCKLLKLNVFVKKSTYSALIDGFCVAKRGDMASKLLLEMTENGHLPGLCTLKSVICVLCETGHADEVLEILDAHVRDSIPDIHFYNTFIKTICRFSRPDIAMKIVEKMCENSCMPDANTYISLLHGYLKSRYVVSAVNLFRALLAETQISSKLYNVMVSGLCTIEKQDLALMYFDEMIRKGMNPSYGCYEKVIYALCKQGDLNKALKCFWDMKQKGYHCTTFIYNVLVGNCFKLHEANHAWFIFDDMRKQGCPPNVSTFSILVAGLSDAKMLESTMGVLEEMMEECFTADILIYNMLLRGLCKEGKMEIACDLFSRMPKKGCLPNASTYDCLIHHLDRAGRVYDAHKLWEEMVGKGLHTNAYMSHFSSMGSNQGLRIVN